MTEHPEITADPKVMTGMPCIKGTRVTVANVVRQIAEHLHGRLVSGWLDVDELGFHGSSLAVKDRAGDQPDGTDEDQRVEQATHRRSLHNWRSGARR